MFQISALYKFSKIDSPSILQKKLKNVLEKLSIKGTILVSKEGINGTISSKKTRNLKNAIKYIKSIKGFDDIDIKYSYSKIDPFIRLKVKLKNEIVTIGDNTINPNETAGDYIFASDWNSLIKKEDVMVIDARNKYECAIGTFKGAINPKTEKFRQFPKWLKEQKFSDKDKENKKIAMFCTGGIRCEKASSLMKKEGFKNIYQLKGGILKYLESVPKKESMWQGECFVFDDRVSVQHDLSEGTYDMCHGCRMPITEKDKTSKKYIKGVSCSNCFDKTSEEQKSRYMSRQRQVDLAKKRNQRHIGPKEEVFN